MDYLKLPGKKLRIEVNWNAITEFCEFKGMNDLAALDNLSQLSAKDLLDFIYFCAKEGERLDGKTFTITPKDLGAELKTPHIVEFMNIYRLQCNSGTPAEETPDSKKKKKRFFHFRNSRE